MAVGDSFGGGTVACTGGAPYLNLIAATDNGPRIRWNKSAGAFIQTFANSENDGLSNTTKIVSAQGSPDTDYAAGVCQSYTGGGYNDWFLPAKNQLNCLYQNKTAIGIFDPGGYWSSTQTTASAAWFQVFATGQQSAGANTDTLAYIRCVRNLAS